MKLNALHLQAMSLAVPDCGDHPNKMPFRGVLTRLDQPSDAPPHGSHGKLVLLPKAVAEKALPSLLGMAVDLTAALNGHDARNKVGLICEADIVGDAIEIGGFIYAADFPEAARDIRANKNALGFSFEMKGVQVADTSANPLVIEDCIFTGAAILRAADAAYTTTSLAAARDKELDMTKEEMEAILAAAMKPLNEEIAALKAGQEQAAADLKASKETHAKIMPHTESMRACSAAMEAAGLGGHVTRGPSAHLNRMADRMDADAMVGKLPHIYRDHDFSVDAGAESATAEPSPELKQLRDDLAAARTEIADLKTKSFNAAAQPERKTDPVVDTAGLLSKFGLQAGADGKVSVQAVDTALEAAGVTGPKAIKAKLKLNAQGLLAA